MINPLTNINPCEIPPRVTPNLLLSISSNVILHFIFPGTGGEEGDSQASLEVGINLDQAERGVKVRIITGLPLEYR